MPIPVAAPAALTTDQQAALAARMGRWRRQPLSPEELAVLLPRVSDPHLALAMGERLGMAGPGAIHLILPLCSSEGLSLPLIKALGICHHPQARDQLLQWLNHAGEHKAAVLEALACWGNQIDPSIIEAALAAPGQDERLAGLGLLTFRSRNLTSQALLHLTEPLLNDIRPEVVIATLRLLQRRQEPNILAAIDRCIQINHLPGVAEMAIQALGCIGTPLSCELLIAQLRQLQHTSLETAIHRQLQAQVRHRHWIQGQLMAMPSP
ncbi:hypothetical protein [Vulcanococcus sp.]|uniref:hypothetical protein n=1 Tax=Vulcanococcus sp. TaxID=2856995 RepID=UPI003F694FAA